MPKLDPGMPIEHPIAHQILEVTQQQDTEIDTLFASISAHGANANGKGLHLSKTGMEYYRYRQGGPRPGYNTLQIGEHIRECKNRRR